MAETPGITAFPEHLGGRPAAELIAEIVRAIQDDQSFLVTTHVNPDGDAIGSEVALGLALRSLGKRVSVVNAEPLPDRYRAFVPDGVVEAGGALSAAGGTFDCSIVVDTSEPERVGDLKPFVFAGGRRKICIDHHPHEARSSFDLHLVVTEAPATGTLVLALLDALAVPLDRTIARLLWLALSTDTGWFRFANTTSVAMRDAARLLDQGLDTESLYDEVYGSHRLGRMRLLGAVLDALKTAHEGRFAWSVVGRKLRDDHGVRLAELDGVIDHFKALDGVRIVALLTELEPSQYKVSLRSLGDTSVDGVARGFGGGGHAKASGFRFRGTLRQLESALTAALDPLLR